MIGYFCEMTLSWRSSAQNPLSVARFFNWHNWNNYGSG